MPMPMPVAGRIEAGPKRCWLAHPSELLAGLDAEFNGVNFRLPGSFNRGDVLVHNCGIGLTNIPMVQIRTKRPIFFLRNIKQAKRASKRKQIKQYTLFRREYRYQIPGWRKSSWTKILITAESDNMICRRIYPSNYKLVLTIIINM